MDERIRDSRRQERRVARRVGGTTNAGSGSGWKRTNDVRSGAPTDKVLWEMKRTGKTQITIKATDLEQVRKTALLEDRMPVMHIEVGGRGYVIVGEDDFIERLT